MVSNLENQRTPLEVAGEITQPQDSLLRDIERLKARNRVNATANATNLCGDEPLPLLSNFGPVEDKQEGLVQQERLMHLYTEHQSRRRR